LARPCSSVRLDEDRRPDPRKGQPSNYFKSAALEQITSTGVIQYFGTDQYGSTRILTNQTGAVVATYSYSPYGALDTHTGTADTPLRWNGQYQDQESGLYYLRARSYDPTTAQFLTPDPLSEITHSAYGYAKNDPLLFDDPTGLSIWQICAGGSFGAALVLSLHVCYVHGSDGHSGITISPGAGGGLEASGGVTYGQDQSVDDPSDMKGPFGVGSIGYGFIGADGYVGMCDGQPTYGWDFGGFTSAKFGGSFQDTYTFEPFEW
ncbi:RHS repeat-associated core domain-containing protein, partial [Nocardioides maradonensis]